jgi:hypothetical protein
MIPQIVKLRGDVNELQSKVADLEAKVELLHQHDLMLVAQLEMQHAHIENLIERLDYLERGNPGAQRRRAWEGIHGGLPEPTATDTPVSPSTSEADRNPAGW